MVINFISLYQLEMFFLNKLVSIVFCQLYFLLCFTSIKAQEHINLPENQKQQIRLTSHILLELDQFSLAEIDTLIQLKTPLALILSSNESKNNSFLNSYFQFRDTLMVIGNKPTKQLSSYPIVYISDTLISPLEFNGAENRSYKELTILLKKDNSIKTDSSLKYKWLKTGKFPNFIAPSKDNLKRTLERVHTINKTLKVFGVLKTKEGLLSKVSFKNQNKNNVSGYFSFPIQDTVQTILIPHKAGYHFSPDIIYYSPENKDRSKEFIGLPLHINYGLTHNYTFNNEIKSQNKNYISNKVIIEKDKIHGTVGYFNNGAYIDASLESRLALQTNFTITAWIKPTKLNFNNSILGKGDNFVLKIHEGNLTFTMAGVKDYVSKKTPIKINQWTHIALTHSKQRNEIVFFINGKQTERIKLIADYSESDFNILIGSNLWEEFFIGYLKEIKIWERELNQNEIAIVFNEKSISSKNLLGIYGVLAIASLLIIGFLIYKKKQKPIKSQKSKAKINKEDHNLKLPSGYKEQILCFGALKIINNQQQNIAEKLSPMLKKLFIIIFLHSQGDKKGINTKKLTELIWPGMSVKDTKNTRGTNIQNLRSLLDSCSEIKVLFLNKHWYLETTENCFCDYAIAKQYLNTFSNSDHATLETELPKLTNILNSGIFLTNISAIWLDPFREKISNQIIEKCLDITNVLDLKKHASLQFQLSEIICIYDDLNEKALSLKLQILIQEGKLSLAHNTYDNFSKLYLKLYKEPYATSFENIVSV